MKRAHEEEDTAAALSREEKEEEGEAMAGPANKKPRGALPSRKEGEEEEEEAEPNFLTMLPYPALRRLLDYLLTSWLASSGASPGMPAEE